MAQSVPRDAGPAPVASWRSLTPDDSSADTDAPPFGHYAPHGVIALLVELCRRCAADWGGRRLAFFLRALAVFLLKGRPLDVETLGVRMRLYPARNVAEKHLLFTPQYFDPIERAFLAERLRGAFTFVDLGANAGGYALAVAARAGPQARILAIEPQPELFARLNYNIHLNRFAGLTARPCAVADRDGDVTLFLDARNQGEASLRPVSPRRSGGQLTVPARTLGALLAEEGVERLDALKIDVEGAESLILTAFFCDVPQRLWPQLLIVEHGPARWPSNLQALLAAQGYRVLRRTRTNLICERAAPDGAEPDGPPPGDILAPDDALPWLVIGWFTPDYRPLAQTLSDGLGRLALPHHFYAKEPGPGGWLGNIRRKPEVVLAALADHPGKTLVLVDVDTEFYGGLDDLVATEGDVVIFSGTKSADILPWHGRRRRLYVSSRVMVWKPTAAAYRLAEGWQRACRKPGIRYGDEAAFIEAYAQSVGVAVSCMEPRFAGCEKGRAPADAVIVHDSVHDKQAGRWRRNRAGPRVKRL